MEASELGITGINCAKIPVFTIRSASRLTGTAGTGVIFSASIAIVTGGRVIGKYTVARAGIAGIIRADIAVITGHTLTEIIGNTVSGIRIT